MKCQHCIHKEAHDKAHQELRKEKTNMRRRETLRETMLHYAKLMGPKCTCVERRMSA